MLPSAADTLIDDRLRFHVRTSSTIEPPTGLSRDPLSVFGTIASSSLRILAVGTNPDTKIRDAGTGLASKLFAAGGGG